MESRAYSRRRASVFPLQIDFLSMTRISVRRTSRWSEDQLGYRTSGSPVHAAMRPAAVFGLPAEDDGSRNDSLLAHNIVSCTHYEHDFEAIGAASAHVVVAIRAASAGQPADRAAHLAVGALAAISGADRTATAPRHSDAPGPRFDGASAGAPDSGLGLYSGPTSR